MGCIKDFVDSKLFNLPECRAILLPVFCNHIKDRLESKEEVSYLKFLLILCLFFINFLLIKYFSIL